MLCKCNKVMTKKVYETDGPEAKEIAQYLPYFPFKVSDDECQLKLMMSCIIDRHLFFFMFIREYRDSMT